VMTNCMNAGSAEKLSGTDVPKPMERSRSSVSAQTAKRCTKRKRTTGVGYRKEGDRSLEGLLQWR